MEQSVQFWDKIAERYAKRPVSNEEEYQKKLSITQQYLRPDMKVLEFGCGTGSTALVHAPKVSSYTAVDFAPKMIDIANEKLKKESIEKLNFKVASLDEFQQEHATYDAVLGLNILHLVEDRDQTIKQVFDLLKPGGVFVSNTACLGNKMGFFRYIAPIGRFLKFIPLVRVFKREELEKSLEQAGFVIDYQWVPEGNKLVYFLVAIKPGDKK